MKKKEWYCGAESHTLSTTYDSGVVANDVIMHHQRHASQTRSKWLGWSGFGPSTFHRACPKHCLTPPLQAERCTVPMTRHSYHTGSVFFWHFRRGNLNPSSIKFSPKTDKLNFQVIKLIPAPQNKSSDFSIFPLQDRSLEKKKHCIQAT